MSDEKLWSCRTISDAMTFRGSTGVVDPREEAEYASGQLMSAAHVTSRLLWKVRRSERRVSE